VRHLLDVLPRRGERDKEAPLTAAGTLQQELQPNGGLARARLAFDQVEMSLGEAAVNDVI
jgi:hypothetical protein